jgi:hypothetical protein
MSSTATAIVNATNKAAVDVTQYAPLVAQAVVQTEAVKATASSSNKAATALGYVMVAAKTAESIPYPPVQAIGSLVEMIDEMVQGFNDSGLFTHQTGTAATSAAAATPAVAAAATVTEPTATVTQPAATADQPTIASLQAQVANLTSQLTLLQTANGIAQPSSSAPSAQTVAAAPAVTAHKSFLGEIFHHGSTAAANAANVAATKT